MERRVLLAFLLSFIVFLLFVRFFSPDVPPPEETGDLAAVESAEAPVQSPSLLPTAPAAAPAAEVAEEAPGQTVEPRAAEQEQRITVATRLFEAEFTNRGARLLGLQLNEHTDGAGDPYQTVPQGDELVESVRPLDVLLPADPSPLRLRSALYEVTVDGLAQTGPVRLDLRDGESREIAFHLATSDGLEVVKTLRITGGDYRMEAQVTAQRGGAEQAKEILYGPGIGNETTTGTYVIADQGVIRTGAETLLFSLGDVREGTAESLSARGVGVSSHYFAGLLVARPGQRYEGRLETLLLPWDSFAAVSEEASGGEREVIVARLVSAGPAEFTLFAGPKQVEVLDELGMDIVDFGFWSFLAIPIRAVLMWSHDFLGNYGWAIVLVTLLISVLLAPLKHYSYVSIRGMQKISPQVKRIQEKYRGLKPTDPRRGEMNQEMAALYREHGVSPIGGCLPMLLMIPFFFAFYRLLVASVELRHAPWVLWIQDLSTEDPYFILPVMMGASQLFMQRMTTTQAEGIQAKIMQFLPVVFVLILAWAPSGLVLYWFANNVFSMGQQIVTQRIMDRREAAAKEAGDPDKAIARTKPARAAASGGEGARKGGRRRRR